MSLDKDLSLLCSFLSYYILYYILYYNMRCCSITYSKVSTQLSLHLKYLLSCQGLELAGTLVRNRQLPESPEGWSQFVTMLPLVDRQMVAKWMTLSAYFMTKCVFGQHFFNQSVWMSEIVQHMRFCGVLCIAWSVSQPRWTCTADALFLCGGWACYYSASAAMQSAVLATVNPSVCPSHAGTVRGGSRKKIFGRQQRLSEITIEPINSTSSSDTEPPRACSMEDTLIQRS